MNSVRPLRTPVEHKRSPRGLDFIMRHIMIRTVCIAFALLLSTAGCTYSRYDLTGQVGRYNDSIEELIEKAVLENVVRSSKDAPMGFTQVAVVRGSGTFTGQVGLPNVTFGPGQAVQQKQWVSSGNGVSGSANTNFDLAVLESKEFWLGLLTPLSPDTLSFFIRQGVPREILFYLYIQRAEIRSGGKTDILINNPLDPQFARFEGNLRDAVNLGLTIDTVSSTYDLGPPIPASNTSNVNDILNVAKAGLSMKPITTPSGTSYQLQGSRSASVLCFDQARSSVNLLDELAPEATCAAMTHSETPEAAAVGAGFPFSIKATAKHGAASIRLYPRSTYDIIRYLGQLVRASEESETRQVDLVSDEAKFGMSADPLSTRLFVVKRNLPGDQSYLTVRYDNANYGVPKSAITTIRVLALVRQLIALSTSVNALPQSGTVTTVVQ
jgi:hypothetical protein